MKARILNIVRGTTVDGPGFRTAIYFAGCAHNCPGCHNPQSWDFSGGEEVELQELVDIIHEEDFDVTLSGGDPLYQPLFTAALIERIQELGKRTWIYTGFLWEEIIENPLLRDAVSRAEAVVEGRFLETLKNPDLAFRGSSNQRIIDVKKSLETSTPVEIMRI
ncbi:MAG: anaerobic ribonucleoside-triphosphate reductase activating protein [Bacteroides sp.]|nr:anaerobic ribonucleoside-triphosphate reductase activating protein [Bacteroidales bacterium]MBD5290820.1 anaerobic ribonucleoside-triphosphate reductase activating protein [Bacteroides sp.]